MTKHTNEKITKAKQQIKRSQKQQKYTKDQINTKVKYRKQSK